MMQCSPFGPMSQLGYSSNDYSHGVPIGAAALQFSLRDPRITATICGVTRTQQVTAKAQVLSDGYFRLSGYQSILMTDFGIEPPTALFGMIQVNNQIDFHFDLYVRVSEVM